MESMVFKIRWNGFYCEFPIEEEYLEEAHRNATIILNLIGEMMAIRNTPTRKQK